MKFRQKYSESVDIEAITFEEFVEYGRSNSTNIIHGIPWSFNYNGVPITNEHNECYLICTHGKIYNFTPQEMLITYADGDVYPCNIEVFKKIYEVV